jgi:hypothetical protein
MSRYENHADEWREEENERKAELEAARRNYYNSGDPRYIAPEESRVCDECGTSIDELSTGQTVCFQCIKELDL